MEAPREISCRFPDYGWAWPKGSLHQLLTAALLPDGRASLAAAWQWLDQNDIDTAGFREQRLLVAISSRFGKDLGSHPSYSKLIGLRRHLWTQSRLAVREAEPALRAMSEAGIRLLLIKGAARIARDPGMEGARISHDADVVVGPREFGRAFDVLHGMGWQAASGASAQRIASEISSLASSNCFSGSSGDIDLHREAFPSIRDARDEERIWDNAEEAGFYGIPVLVPSRSDQAALAIAHGCLAAHIHSDWLIDCVDAVSSVGFSWDDFLSTVTARRLFVGATIALSYLAGRLSVAIPSEVLGVLITKADQRSYAERFGILLQAKPRNDMGPLLHAARWVAKRRRMRREASTRSAAPSLPSFRGWRILNTGNGVAKGAFGTVHELSVAGWAGDPGRADLEIDVEVEAPNMKRRIELEINGTKRHVARLRSRVRRGKNSNLFLRFRGRAELDPADFPLSIESRPLRQIRSSESEESAAPYRALRFRLVSFACRRKRS